MSAGCIVYEITDIKTGLSITLSVLYLTELLYKQNLHKGYKQNFVEYKGCKDINLYIYYRKTDI